MQKGKQIYSQKYRQLSRQMGRAWGRFMKKMREAHMHCIILYCIWPLTKFFSQDDLFQRRLPVQARGRQYLSSEIDEEGLPKRMLERTVGDVYSIDRDLSMQSIWKYRGARARRWLTVTSTCASVPTFPPPHLSTSLFASSPAVLLALYFGIGCTVVVGFTQLL